MAHIVIPTYNCDTIVAVDFGMSATGYSIVFRPAGGVASPLRADMARVRLFPPSGSAEGAKELTAVMLRNDAERSFVAFGDRARAMWFLYLERFKMGLSPDGRERSVFDLEVTAMDTNIRVPLMTPFVRILEHVRGCALEKLRLNLGAAPDENSIGWVLTVPAMWDDAAKQFMREAARRAKLIPDVTCARLQIALEPECAGIAACVLEERAEVRDRLERIGTKLLVVDCGGGTVDVVAQEVRGANPLSLTEIARSSSGAWGSTYVDKRYEEFLERLVSAPVYAALDKSTRCDVRKAWDAAKLRYNPASPDEGNVVDVERIRRNLEQLRRDDASVIADMGQLVTAYNARYPALTCTWRETRGRLELSTALMDSFTEPLVAETVRHIRSLLARPGLTDISVVLLVGGFAASPYMQRAFKREFATATRLVVTPVDAAGAVLRGAAWFGLYRDAFITDRVAKHTYAIRVAETFDAASHPRDAMIPNDMGEPLALVMDPLVCVGDRVSVAHESAVRSCVPANAGDTTVKLELYRSDLVMARRGEGMRTLPGDGPGRVPASARIGVVPVDLSRVPVHLRECDVAIAFGRTELTVRATVYADPPFTQVVGIQYGSQGL